MRKMINLNQLNKGVFKRLNKHTKEMATRQRGQVESYNQTLERYNRLVKIKINYDAYLRRGDDEKKPSIITQIK